MLKNHVRRLKVFFAVVEYILRATEISNIRVRSQYLKTLAALKFTWLFGLELFQNQSIGIIEMHIP
jgi:hypothetical protein